MLAMRSSGIGDCDINCGRRSRRWQSRERFSRAHSRNCCDGGHGRDHGQHGSSHTHAHANSHSHTHSHSHTPHSEGRRHSHTHTHAHSQVVHAHVHGAAEMVEARAEGGEGAHVRTGHHGVAPSKITETRHSRKHDFLFIFFFPAKYRCFCFCCFFFFFPGETGVRSFLLCSSTRGGYRQCCGSFWLAHSTVCQMTGCTMIRDSAAM